MDLTIETRVKNRLIVLIPDHLASHSDLARQVHWMADRENLSVFFLVVADGGDEMLDTMRRVATLKALTSAGRLEVESKLVAVDDIYETLQSLACPEDRVAVLDDEHAAGGYLMMIPINEFLANRPQLHFSPAAPARSAPWVSQLVALVGFLVIITAFTWLEFNLHLAFTGGLHKAFLLVMFGAELVAIMVWNKATSR